MPGKGKERESTEMTLKTTTAPAPSTSSSEDHTSILQSHHAQLAHFNAALRQSTLEFSKCLFQLKCQPAPEWRLPLPPKPPSKPKPQPPVPDVVREDKQLELVDIPPPKSSTNSTLLSAVLTQAVEEAVEEEVKVVVVELDLLQASLDPQGKAKLLYLLQQTLK